MFKRVRGAVTNYVGSVSGDFNQIKNTVGSKFGSMENLSNTFDQRIADGLTDLLTGATGIRTSSIPEINADAINARNDNRAKRQQVLTDALKERGEGEPIQSEKLLYPHNFIVESGSRRGSEFRGRVIVGGSRADIPDEVGDWQTASADTQRMTNYIHFRTLKRRVVGNRDNEKHYDIFLYVPNTLSDAINTTYSEAEKGLTEGAIASTFDLDGTGAFSGNQFGTWTEIKEILKSAAPGADLVKAAAGKTVNPLKFQLFQGVNMRSYTYNFEFRPMSDTESGTIREIAYAFRKSMLPGTIGALHRTYTFPNEWAIRYHGPIKQWVDYPMTTVCTNATVNWAPNGFVHMVDGAPATVTLALTFTELVALDRERFDKRSSAHMQHDTEVRENSQVGSFNDVGATTDEPALS